jgi:ubiquinone/menaquinone biosynthesis C-methylase UbiE
MSQANQYIPALGHDSLTPLYDPLLSWVMRESTFKQALIGQSAIAPNQRVLDLGCGTATLTILIKQAQPQADVVGLDGDPRVLAIGRAKAQKAGVSLTLEEGLAYQLPYPTDSFDRVLSSLVLHHLTRIDRERALAEAFRVLRPGGELHIVDFGRPRHFVGRLVGSVMSRFEQTADLIEGLLPAMIGQAGFMEVKESRNFATVFGTLTLYQARKQIS